MRQFNCINAAHPLVRYYLRHLLCRTANAVLFYKRDIVLDFGSGERAIQAFLPSKVRYISCDKNEEFESDYSDIQQVKEADIIIASNVLEHLSVKELRQTISEFLRLNPRLIIVAMPRETSLLNKALNFVFRYTFEHGWEHKTGWKEITGVLSEYFDPVEVRGFWFMQWIIVIKPR